MLKSRSIVSASRRIYSALVFPISILFLASSPANADVVPVGGHLLDVVQIGKSVELSVLGEFKGSQSFNGGMNLTGTFDTELLTVNLPNLEFLAQTDITLRHTFSRQVQNTVTTTTPGPGPFDPPTVETVTTDFGNLVINTIGLASISVDTEALPSVLQIDSSSLRTEVFGTSLEYTLHSLQVDAVLDGVTVFSQILSDPGASFQQTLFGYYQCGGTIPNAFCGLVRENIAAGDYQRSISIGITFEDVFGIPHPSEGTTNFIGGAISVSIIPEPSCAMMIGMGLAALAFRRRHTLPEPL